MLAVIDTSAPFVSRDDRGMALARALEERCDTVIAAAGPDAIVRQMIGVGAAARDVVCLGRPSTTSAALTGAFAGGADVRTLRVRHIGGPGIDPWVATLELDTDPEKRWRSLERPRGAQDVTLLRVDDFARPWATLGLVFGAGAAREMVQQALRGDDGRFAAIKGLGRAVGGTLRPSTPDPDWRASDWSVDGAPLRDDAAFLVASSASLSLGPFRLVGGGEQLHVLLGASPSGRDALRALADRSLPVDGVSAPRIDADTTAGWTLDGWSQASSGARGMTLRVGPTIRFFV